MKISKKIVCLLLAFVLICSACFISGMAVSALDKRHGYINDDKVNIRTGPATSYESLGKLDINTPVLVTGVGFKGTDKTIWYKLTAYTATGEIEGYVHSSYVTVTGSDRTVPAVMKKNSSIYSSPGTWHSKLAAANIGMSLTIIGEELDYDGDKWYHVVFQLNGASAKGYAYSECVELRPVYEEDAEFEKHLENENFPESYKEGLRKLHALYPNWVFLSDELDITWQEAFNGETEIGRSTVGASSAEAWKSMESGAYDWVENEYEIFDTGGWVTAADNVVAYYLDPRNSLDASAIFQFISMDYDEKINTKENLQSALDGTFMEGEFPEDTYETYADVLMEAARQTDLSPIALAAMIIIEQGSGGTGKSISGVQPGYVGYYNFYNWSAYPAGGLTAVQHGLSYAKSKGWNTRAKSIIEGAHEYVTGYISRGQDTLYYKKFNVVHKPYFSHQYMTNIQGAYSEGIKTAGGYQGVMNSKLVFNIPVYKDMPEDVAPYPTKTGNNNCYLEDISLNSISYSPTFNRYKNEYDAIVEPEVDKVVVTAVLSNSGAKVTGEGEYKLKAGANIIELTVTSTSGLKNVYSVAVFRQEPEIPDIVDPTFSSELYKINETHITQVPAGTSKQVFLTNFRVEGGTARFTHEQASVKTGDIIEILDNAGEVRYTYTIIVNGDINCDGKLTLVDIARMQRFYLKLDQPSGNASLASDMNGDGKFTLTDIALVQRKLLRLDD